ncbi:MAG: HD-like signal output (HDOD) protein [Paraglaciecola sp.]|jgi:HD-like signal output (HDOD) protein
MSTENTLLTILVHKINHDILVLPTLPAIALKVRKATDDPNINLKEIADVIAQDVSLSARMVKIANSAHMGHRVKVSSVSQAVTCIGLSQLKYIATALAMEQLFVSKSQLIKAHMQQIWIDTVEVVAHSIAALQVYILHTKNRTLSLDTLTLAALVHNIGLLPILSEADRYPDVFANSTFLLTAFDKLTGPIGASIMSKWGFEQDFMTIAEHWKNMDVQSKDVSYLDFVRLGAALAGKFDEQQDAIFAMAIAKGMVSDLDFLHSEEFNEMCHNAKQIFA